MLNATYAIVAFERAAFRGLESDLIYDILISFTNHHLVNINDLTASNTQLCEVTVT